MAVCGSTSLKELWISGRKIVLLLMWEMLFKLSFGLLTGNTLLDYVFMSITKSLSLLLAPLVGLLADVGALTPIEADPRTCTMTEF